MVGTLGSIHHGSLFFILFGTSWATNYYYAMYRSYGTGDTVITSYHGAGGSNSPNRKWQVECFDGEAAIGISDTFWDFGAISYVWCKFMFPFKPPSQGLYPYYRDCHVRDLFVDFFCYDKANHSSTINGMITGFWDSDMVFWTFSGTDQKQPYKCCRVPAGYYIDYVSCYYLVTHDPYWEYYDGNYFLVNCATGYVMTGASAKKNPTNGERRIEWIQCCRVGWGSVIAVEPPLINVKGRPPSYSSSNYANPVQIPSGYQQQYRKKRSVRGPSFHDDKFHANRTIEKNMMEEDAEMSWHRYGPAMHDEHNAPPNNPLEHELTWTMMSNAYS